MTQILSGPQDFLADEDMQILISISAALVERLGKFSINLRGGVSLSNEKTGNFGFVGIDTLKSTLDQIMLAAGDSKFRIIMPTNRFESRKEIGNLFDIPVFADPAIPKDKFLIQEIEEKHEN